MAKRTETPGACSFAHMKPERLIPRDVQGRPEEAIELVMRQTPIDLIEARRIDHRRVQQILAADPRRLDGFSEGVDEVYRHAHGAAFRINESCPFVALRFLS
jgi:hypothetical protein